MLMGLNGALCADVPLRNYTLTSLMTFWQLSSKQRELSTYQQHMPRLPIRPSEDSSFSSCSTDLTGKSKPLLHSAGAGALC